MGPHSIRKRGVCIVRDPLLLTDVRDNASQRRIVNMRNARKQVMDDLRVQTSPQETTHQRIGRPVRTGAYLSFSKASRLVQSCGEGLNKTGGARLFVAPFLCGGANSFFYGFLHLCVCVLRRPSQCGPPPCHHHDHCWQRHFSSRDASSLPIWNWV